MSQMLPVCCKTIAKAALTRSRPWQGFGMKLTPAGRVPGLGVPVSENTSTPMSGYRIAMVRTSARPSIRPSGIVRSVITTLIERGHAGAGEDV
jgi:hypothetical protein